MKGNNTGYGKMKRIVVIDDKNNILRVLKVILEKQGYWVETFTSAAAALDRIVVKQPDVIISDIRMDGMDGKELFFTTKSKGIHVPFMFITAYGTVEDAVSLMKEGAVDYLQKPLDYKQLKERINLLVNKSAKDVQRSHSESKVLIGSSKTMSAIYSRIETVADTNSTVLIEGESGTGKELVARAIHRRSKRREKPFLAVNCSAFNENLLESELFGHEKGAFTDAVRRKKGIFEEAEGGTLFLDEISELPPSTQVKLLRVLQEKVFSRVGGNEIISTDVRIIAAANKRLQKLVEAGTFRRDLFYRLNVIPFNIPPLREHQEDISELTDYFIRSMCEREGISVPEIKPEVIHVLMQYEWPGNIRELENIIERIVILHSPQVLSLEQFKNEPEFASLMHTTMDERAQLVSALEECRGNKSKAAKYLGISRRSLYYKLEKFGIQFGEK
ncbi:MAG: sigma-54 dependent transcriptional regulator [Spirochaetia bacterium]|nr:sigma-54 dependent transcriptional regulator [Spirochaetia bacterium]